MRDDEPPFEGGAQPVPEHPPEMPRSGRGAAQLLVIALSVLALVAALIWILVPLLGGRG